MFNLSTHEKFEYIEKDLAYLRNKLGQIIQENRDLKDSLEKLTLQRQYALDHSKTAIYLNSGFYNYLSDITSLIKATRIIEGLLTSERYNVIMLTSYPEYLFNKMVSPHITLSEFERLVISKKSPSDALPESYISLDPNGVQLKGNAFKLDMEGLRDVYRSV